ncbi:MAG: polyamine ABC transporter substrate-binding protein [Bordetella sp.]|nr:MAG: polyamine ABC transporter substrate-binding protein [Bordetella sp.]
MKVKFKLIIFISLMIAVMVMFIAITNAKDRVVNIYNWAEYKAPDTLTGFEKKTGIRFRYDVYDSNDTLQAKLLTGKSGYDIVVPSSHYASRQIQNGFFQKLDKSKIPNLRYLDKDIMALVAEIDPDNLHAVPWGYGTNGLGFNITKVRKILGNDIALGTWDLLFKPENASKLKECGISILDEAAQVFPAVLKYLGKDPNSSNPDDYKTAFKVLKSIRPYIRQFSSSGYIDELVVGDLCMAYSFSGDVMIARKRAKEAKKTYEIQYFIPEGGSPAWFDLMLIPKDAPHVEEAHTFINYMETPQVHAAITNTMFYPNANKEARKYVMRDIANNAMIYPSENAAKSLYVIKVQPPNIQRLQTRLWADLKSSK